jgi:DNA gyrase/topoisomerase IV, subunit A
MFSGVNPKLTKAIAAKNQRLMGNYNKTQALDGAHKILTCLKSLGLRISDANYEKLRKRHFNINATHPISKRNYITVSRLHDHLGEVTLKAFFHSWSPPDYGKGAKGLTVGLSKKQSPKPVKLLGSKNSMRSKSLVCEALMAEYYASKNKCALRRVPSEAWDNLREGAVPLSRRRGGSLLTNDYRKKSLADVDWLYLTNAVIRIEVLSMEKAVKFYDFTVNGLENMLIASGKTIDGSLSLSCVHNSSVVGAIGTTVVSNANPIAGVGNWGSIIDSIGADRYTNVLLSKYGKTFFHPSYLPLSTLIPNYDDKDVEPLFIPALLPNLLLNGAEGIGLGLTTKIPAFTPASLLPLLADMAEDKDISDKEIAKRLEFSHQYGGVAVKSKANFLKVIELLNATSASIQWTSPFEVDRDKKCITISNFGPEVNPITLIENKVKPLSEVSSVHSGKGVSYSIQIRKDLNFNEFDKFVEKFTKMVSTSISYQLYVTTSKMVDGKKKVKFANVTLKDLMGRWVKYRIALEVASLKYRISVHEKRDLYLSLLIRACDSLDLIFKALRSSDPKASIVKGMKITEEEADIILNLKVRQLTKLDQDQLTAERKEIASKIQVLNKMLKQPKQVVADYLRNAVDQFTLERHDCSLQWTMK